MTNNLKAPFPYFGGKSTIAHTVWQRFGDVAAYVEPFFGSGAVLLARPHDPGIETVNDIDSMISNFWRSVRSDPDTVAYHADYPAIESDLHARHAWLVRQRESLTDRIQGDPDYYDAKIAGWWCWGMSLWIGGGFCSGKGPWVQENGALINKQGTGRGISKKRIHLSNGGRGVQKISRKDAILEWIRALSDRLRRVRVCCGDWQRVTGASVTTLHGMTGVFLDPPYGEFAGRNNNLYAKESATVAYDCQRWCIENGTNKLMRITLCGYQGEHEILANYGWQPYYWKAQGGMANTGKGKGKEKGKENAKREVIWFSPHCLQDNQMSMF